MFKGVPVIFGQTYNYLITRLYSLSSQESQKNLKFLPFGWVKCGLVRLNSEKFKDPDDHEQNGYA